MPSWSGGLSLRGKDGLKGDSGAVGSIGPQGPKGDTGPAGTSGLAQPALGSFANAWGPPSTASVASAASGVNVSMQVPGTSQTYTFIPDVDTICSGAQITNFGTTGAAIYVGITDITDTTQVQVSQFNAGSGIASGSINYFAQTGTAAIDKPATLKAGRKYIFYCVRFSAGPLYAYFCPTLTRPSSSSASISYFGAAVYAAASPLALSATRSFLLTAGVLGQPWYYRYNLTSYFAGALYNLAGSGTAQLVLYNLTTSAVVYTSDTITLSSAGTVGNIGPFGVATAAFLAANNYQWAVIGSGSLVSASVIPSVGQ